MYATNPCILLKPEWKNKIYASICSNLHNQPPQWILLLVCSNTVITTFYQVIRHCSRILVPCTGVTRVMEWRWFLSGDTKFIIYRIPSQLTLRNTTISHCITYCHMLTLHWLIFFVYTIWDTVELISCYVNCSFAWPRSLCYLNLNYRKVIPLLSCMLAKSN